MNNSHKIQKWLSFIPFLSSVIIVIITYIALHRNKVRPMQWVMFSLICSGTILIVFVLNEFVMSGKFLILNFIATFCIITLMNFMLIDLQIKSAKTRVLEESTKDTASKSHFRNNVIIIVVVCVLVVASLSFVGVKVYNGWRYHREHTIEDTNGENDYSLNTITKEEIEATLSDYTIRWFGESFEGDKTSVGDEVLSRYDCDRAYMQAKSYSGIRPLQVTKTSENTIQFSVNSTVKSGNFAIIIFVENEYYCEVEINKSENIVLENIADKTVLIKVAGESADVTIEIVRG